MQLVFNDWICLTSAKRIFHATPQGRRPQPLSLLHLKMLFLAGAGLPLEGRNLCHACYVAQNSTHQPPTARPTHSLHITLLNPFPDDVSPPAGAALRVVCQPYGLNLGPAVGREAGQGRATDESTLARLSGPARWAIGDRGTKCRGWRGRVKKQQQRKEGQIFRSSTVGGTTCII